MFRLLPLFVCWIGSLAAQPIPGRYILELDGDPLVGAKEKRSERAAALRSQHQRMRSILSSRNVRVRGTVDTVANAVIVEGADPAVLANLPGVKRVVQSRYLQLKLDHAMNLLKFPEAWVKAGGRARAGGGMKIGILDTGIDNYHAAFQDEELTPPDGFPVFSPEGNQRFTNSKIIAARSYSGTAEDMVGHGTSVAAAAASAYHQGPRGVMAGAAPKAWLGNYQIAEGTDGAISVDNALRALDDAVKDGMDVVNLSFAGPAISLPEDDLITPAIARAAGAGVIVIAAAGNEGPDNATASDSGASMHAVAVGASENDRLPTSPAVISLPSTRFTATPASNSEDVPQVTGKLADVAALDPSGLACDPLPAGSLDGKIALILRGTCNFSVKFQNARRAGAVAVVVYNSETSPTRVIMQVEDEPLKGMMVSRADGTTLKGRVAANGDSDYVLFFSFGLPEDPNRLADFSSRGPGPDMAIKPDMVATGTNLITATNETPEGSPELSGYVVSDGTSLSAPIVAGVAAVLKQVRPGLTAAQYRSLLINSSLPFPEGAPLQVQRTGAGLLRFPETLTAVTAIEPPTVSFGEYRGLSNWFREITVTNVGDTGDNLTLALNTTDSMKPELSTTALTLAPKGSAVVKLTWNDTTAPAGAYQGFLEIRSTTGSVARVPYWMGVRSPEPKEISLTYVQASARAGANADILFRVLDGSGISLIEPPAEVNVTSGGGRIVQQGLAGSIYPGVYGARVRLGPSAGVNVFEIKVGGVTREVRIRATN